jgi:hypothetical protein
VRARGAYARDRGHPPTVDRLVPEPCPLEEQPRPSWTDRLGRECSVDQRERLSTVARDVATLGGYHGAPRSGVGIVLAAESERPLGQVGSRFGRAAHARTERRIVQDGREHRVRAFCAEREVARTLLAVVDQVGETPVQRAPTWRGERRVRGGREERVVEANAFAVEYEHSGREGRLERVDFERLERRLPERRHRCQRLLRLSRQSAQAPRHESLEIAGHR